MDRTGRSNLPGHTFPRNCTVRSIDDYKKLPTLPDDAVILSTGDPMLAGLGYLKGEVIPGISSLQIAVARLHIPLSRVAVVVAHGRGHEQGMQDTVDEVKRGKIVFLLADPKFNVSDLYSRLAALSLPLQIAVWRTLPIPTNGLLWEILHHPRSRKLTCIPLSSGIFKKAICSICGKNDDKPFLLRVQE